MVKLNLWYTTFQIKTIPINLLLVNILSVLKVGNYCTETWLVQLLNKIKDLSFSTLLMYH